MFRLLQFALYCDTAPQFFPLLSLYMRSVLPSSNMLSEGIMTGLGGTTDITD